MRERTIIVGALALAIALVFGALGSPGDAEAKPPVVLMFHGGGFAFGEPSYVDYPASVARQRGARVLQVRYPLGDPKAALRCARRLAQRFSHRRVLAYGESAGGALAVRLAQSRGLVDRAAAYSPAVKTTRLHFYRDRPGLGRAMNLDRRTVRVPTLALAAEGDTTDNGGFRRRIVRWAQGDPKVQLRRVEGLHTSGAEYPRNARAAVRWLLR
jgi:acetyl esterase/lipase